VSERVKGLDYARAFTFMKMADKMSNT